MLEKLYLCTSAEVTGLKYLVASAEREGEERKGGVRNGREEMGERRKEQGKKEGRERKTAEVDYWIICFIKHKSVY